MDKRTLWLVAAAAAASFLGLLIVSGAYFWLGRITERAVPQSDLSALVQTSQTTAAWVSAIISATAVCTSVAAIYFLVQQIQIARNIGNRQIKISRKIGEATARAYISISSATIEVHPKSNSIRADICISNSGQSPALDVEAIISIKWFGNTREVGDVTSTLGMPLPDVPGGEKSHAVPLLTIRRDFGLERFEPIESNLLTASVTIAAYAYDVFGKEIRCIGRFNGKVDSEQKNRLALSRRPNLDSDEDPIKSIPDLSKFRWKKRLKRHRAYH